MGGEMNSKVGDVTVTWNNLEKTLLRIMRLWRRNAQAKLRREGKNATGELTRSMKTRLYMMGGDIVTDITPQVLYWQYVDGGVRGSKTSPWARQGTNPNGGRPFAFTTKKPPLDEIKTWMQVKGIMNRDSKGRFKSGDGLAFGIQNSIFSRGLKPTFFISDTGDRIEKKYANEIAVAYATDMGEALSKMIDDKNKS